MAKTKSIITDYDGIHTFKEDSMTETEIKEDKWITVNDLLKAAGYMTDEEVNTVKQIKDNCYSRYNQLRKTGQLTLSDLLNREEKQNEEHTYRPQ